MAGIIDIPARSTKIHLYNNTPYTLVLQSYPLDHGIWTDGLIPQYLVNPGAYTQWQSESDGFATGTEGSVVYEIYVKDPPPPRLHIHWQNPFFGGNSLTYNIGDTVANVLTFTIEGPSDISGNNAVYEMKLTSLNDE